MDFPKEHFWCLYCRSAEYFKTVGQKVKVSKMKELGKKKPIPRVAVIHDLCSIGKAAMTNIIPVLSVMGLEVCPIPTMILSTHTGGFGKPVMHALPAFVEECAQHLKEQEISFEHIFIGYLGNARMVESIRDFLKNYPDADILLDPIMADHGAYYMNFNEEYGKTIQKILKYSHTITPNYTESCFLTEESYQGPCTKEKLLRICRRLTVLGANQIIITSVPFQDSEMGIAVYEKEELHILKKKRVGRAYPGTGDLFAAVLKGRMILGDSLFDAADKAHEFVCRCIKMSDAYGYPVREGVMLEPNLKYLL